MVIHAYDVVLLVHSSDCSPTFGCCCKPMTAFVTVNLVSLFCDGLSVSLNYQCLPT